MFQSYYFNILFLFFIFYDELFFFSLIAMGREHEAGMKTYEVAALGISVFLLFIHDAVTKNICTHTWKALLAMVFAATLYYFTQLFYYEENAHYNQFLLVFCGECIPATYLGARLAQGSPKNWIKLDRLLPFFVIPLTLVLGTTGLTYAQNALLMYDDKSGMSYQAISYFMAYSYSYCAYYVFFSPLSGTREYKFFRAIMLPIMLFAAITCLMSGGRGAFLYIIIISLFIVYSLKKVERGHFFRFLLTIIIVGALFIGLSFYLDVWGSRGMERVTSSLLEDDVRTELYHKALTTFESSPFIGHGLGSIWFTVGFYSHNMFMDLLVEIGIFGTVFFITLLAKTFIKLYRFISVPNTIYLLMFIFMGTFIHEMFSGYYWGALKFYMIFAFAYVYKNKLHTLL